MQNILPDLKICQEAKDKGIKIESKFWIDNEGEYYQDISEQCAKDYGRYPAPLTDEILKVLPKFISLHPRNHPESNVSVRLSIYCGKRKGFSVSYLRAIRPVYDKKLSNALLLLAIRLKEEGIIKL